MTNPLPPGPVFYKYYIIHPMASCFDRVARAQDNLKAFDEEMSTFLKTNPHDWEIETNTNRTEYIYRARVKALPPIRLNTIIGECLHNLRSSLDHIVYQLAGRPEGDSKTEFPIFNDATKYKKAVKYKHLLDRVSAEAKTLIEALQPYHAHRALIPLGPPLLLALYHLSNFDKHRNVHFIFGVGKEIRIRSEEPPVSYRLNPVPILVDRAELARFTFSRPDVKMDPEFDFMLWLKVPGIERMVPITYLQGTIDLIENQILPQFKRFF